MPATENFNEQEKELFEHHRFIADPGQGPLRIDKFLMMHIENVSRNKIQQAAAAGSILVNEKPVKQNYKVRPGDVISIVLTEPPRDTEIIPEDIPVAGGNHISMARPNPFGPPPIYTAGFGPKMTAVLRYLENGGRRAIITSAACLENALEGKDGTHIVWGW